MHKISSGDMCGTFWHDKSFDWLRNRPAILKYVVFVTTSPGLPYMVAEYKVLNSPYQNDLCLAYTYFATTSVTRHPHGCGEYFIPGFWSAWRKITCFKFGQLVYSLKHANKFQVSDFK